MALPATTTEAIQRAAVSPKSATVDSETVTQRDGRELIELDRYQKGEAAKAKNHRGLAFAKLIPGGGG